MMLCIMHIRYNINGGRLREKIIILLNMYAKFHGSVLMKFYMYIV